jgi:general stress protein YciG
MSDNNLDIRSLNSVRRQPDPNAGEQSNPRESSETVAPAPKAAARRGFAAMDQQTQREIARKGGHSQGKENNRGNFFHDRERARIAGRKGGEAHGKNRQEPASDTERQ